MLYTDFSLSLTIALVALLQWRARSEWGRAMCRQQIERAMARSESDGQIGTVGESSAPRVRQRLVALGGAPPLLLLQLRGLGWDEFGRCCGALGLGAVRYGLGH